MIEKTNVGLVEHCKKALSEKWFYGWGTYGQKASSSLVSSVVKKYPSMNNRWKNYMLEAVSKQTRLCDCYGLVKGYLFTQSDGELKYNGKYDLNTRMAYDKATEKGALSTMPDLMGVVLYMTGHVGVYIGNGEFIELAGGGIGARKGKIENGKITKGSKFTHWFKDASIEYIPRAEELPVSLEKDIPVTNGESKTDLTIQSFAEIGIIIDGKEVNVTSILKGNKNYVNLRELANILGYHVDYDPFENVPILTQKD